MTAPAHRRMTADEFLDWAMAQPEGTRYELVAGEVVARAPERAGHGRAKLAAVDALRAAVALAGLPCEAFVDGMAVRVDGTTIYEPDVLLRCGPPVADDCVEIADPVIVVEVLSPSSRSKDTGGKLDDYFRLPSVRHYLIVKIANRTVIHHRRDDAGALQTRILRDGTLELRPPGLAVEVAALFPSPG
jgi:Uma2 family endonuclease